MDVSFEEKSAWVMLLGLVFVFLLYGWFALRMLAGGSEAAAFLPLFLICSVVLVVVLVAGHVVAALTGRPEGADERDRLVRMKAESSAMGFLEAVVLLAALGFALPVQNAWVANGLIAGLFLAEIMRYGLRAWYYRRGV